MAIYDFLGVLRAFQFFCGFLFLCYAIIYPNYSSVAYIHSRGRALHLHEALPRGVRRGRGLGVVLSRVPGVTHQVEGRLFFGEVELETFCLVSVLLGPHLELLSLVQVVLHAVLERMPCVLDDSGKKVKDEARILAPSFFPSYLKATASRARPR